MSLAENMQRNSRITEIIEYLRQCPQLYELWSIAGNEDIDNSVILPQGASQAVQYIEQVDVYGNYECDIRPFPSVYEDFQINCFKFLDFNDSSEPSVNLNILNYNDVQAICDWVSEQDRNGNLPTITGRKVVSVECNPFVPQIRYVDSERNIVAYFVTVRVRYVNPNLSTRHIEYAAENNS